MLPAYVIGADIGTGSVKCLAIDASGNELAAQQMAYPPFEKENEQDPGVVYKKFIDCINGLVAALKTPPQAVAFSSAMHSILAVDNKGKPLTNALLWSHSHSSHIAEALRHTELGLRLHTATGTPVHAMSPLCKLSWLQQTHPDVYNNAARFISIKEYTWHRLFGEYCIDHSLASATGLFNIRQLKWESEALQFLSLSVENFSLPVPTSYRNHHHIKNPAFPLNVPSDVPFIIGASDGCLANLGTLCLAPTEAAITMGTSAAVRVTTSVPVAAKGNQLFQYRLDENSFVCGGSSNNGGNVLHWLANHFFGGETAAENIPALFAWAEEVPAGSGGLIFLPYLHGERAPVWDEKSSGVFLGIKAGHNRSFFVKAALEGMCYALKEILTIVEEDTGEVSCIKFSGALSQSATMAQLLADVTNRKVVVQAGGDASARGAAFLALQTLRLIPNYAALVSKEATCYTPNSNNASVYQRGFVIYKSLYPQWKQTMHLLHSYQ